MNSYLVYLISHPDSNHYYVGKTNDLKQRIRKHYDDSRKKNKTFIHQWIRKYPDFNVEILEDNIDEPTSFMFEKMYVGLFKSWNISLMNLTNGGEGTSGNKHTDVTKQILSNVNKGKYYSEESRKLMSEKRLGEKHPLYGKPMSLITKYKNAMSSCKDHHPVNVYDLIGNLLYQFDSHITAKYTLYPDPDFSTGEILSNCIGKQLTCHGYIFQYQSDDQINDILERIKSSTTLNKNIILQYDMDMNFIAEYKSSYQAEKTLRSQGINIYSGDIRHCCEGKYKQAKTFIWKYGNENNISPISSDNILPPIIENKPTPIIEQPIIINSNPETLLEYIKSLNIYFESFDNYIKLIDKKIVISYNTPQTHNSLNRNKRWAIDEIIKWNNNGFRLIHVWENDWLNKPNIIKSQLDNILGLTQNKIYARKCIIKEIHSHNSNCFLKENHLQGYTVSKINLGLYYNDELVSVMTFGSLRKNLGGKSIPNHYELLRFCNKLNIQVIGGASKLFKYFKTNHHPEYIISYANRDWSQGNLYKKLTMVENNPTEPGYDWYKDRIKYNRFKFRKSELVKQGFDPNKTEDKIMIEQGYLKVYNSGNLKFIWNHNY